jgi:excisionase family DNA binding protein
MSVNGFERLLLKREEAAELLGMGVRTLDAHVRQGHVQAVYLGRLVRFDRAELERVAREGIPPLRVSPS